MGQMAEGVEAKYLVSLLPPSTQNFEADSFHKKTGQKWPVHPSLPLLAWPAVFFREFIPCTAGQASSGTLFQRAAK
jgi:hypothetical protein